MSRIQSRKSTRVGAFFLAVFLLALASGASGAVQQVETKYFTIVYDENGEYTAGEIAKFCDEIYENLMSRYDSFTDDPRVLCVVNDAMDLANGFAIYFQNTITIYATNMDYELRGQTNWLRNVFVHEMTHMIALKKAAKGPVNFISLGGGKYNDNPDLEVDVAWYHLSQPGWFSEGTAQVGAESFGSEHWDSHRAMLLRSAWFEDKLLTIGEMSSLAGKGSFDAEMLYNQGYSMVRFIKETYGYDRVVDMNNTSGFFDFNPTIKRVLNISPKQLYQDWRADLDRQYASFKNRRFVEGEKIADKGNADYYPVLSPDGAYLAWLSDRGRDYTITDLMLKDMRTGKVKRIVKNVDYRVTWSHDSSKLLYVRRPERSPRFYDIYTYEVAQGKERRISKNMRARDPSFSPGDSLIVFVRNAEGNNTISVIDADGTGLRYLSATRDGMQFYMPSFSTDCSQILFSVYKQDMDRDIAVIDTQASTYRHHWEYADSTSGFSDSTSFAENSNFRLILASGADERDPCYLPDGSGIVYTSDRTGVFNLYRLDFATSKTTRLTDLYGGAFAPSVGSDGQVCYAGYKAKDFSIYQISLDSEIEKYEPIIEERDYFTQPKGFDLGEHFNVEPYRRKRILNAIVPTLTVGPSFIGSRFGLNVVDVGAQVYVSDLVGYDALILAGNIGMNYKEEVGLNNHAEFYYERAMVPVTSSKYSHAPRMYLGASRTVINNYIPRLEAVADSAYYGDIANNGFENVLHDLHAKFTIADIYRDEFRRYRLGVFVPLARRHSLRLEAGFRQYYETLKRNEKINDYSNFFLEGEKINDQIPGTGQTRSYDTRFFTDMEYFQSRELDVTYLYSRIDPSADMMIAPRGTSVMLRYRHMRSAVTDSLVDQPELYIPLGLNMDGSFALATYNPDPLLDELRPYRKNTDINEYMLIFQDYRKLPLWRHTFNTLLFAAYKDIYIRDYYKGEGSGYNWPLKYYLGGGNVLSGYPYFAFWGSKLFYSRFGYTFPVMSNIAKNFMGLTFQSLYGNVFFEAAKIWNFRRASMDELKKGAFKRDIGFELRSSTIAFYRLTTLIYARIVWPLDGMGDSRDENDARRFYFGLRM